MGAQAILLKVTSGCISVQSETMAARRVLLPLLIAAMACSALFCGLSFVCGSNPSATATTRSLRTSRHAVPVEFGSSVATALEVTAAAWGANIALLVVPFTFLIQLYLQSERTKAEKAELGLDPYDVL